MTETTNRMIKRLAILAMLVIVAFTGYRVLSVKPHLQRTGYVVGEEIDLPAGAVRPAHTTIIMFGDSACPACQASKNAVMQIAAAVREHDAAIQQITNRGRGEAELKFAEEMGIERGDVMTTSGAYFRKIQVVPTFVVLDRNRKILRVHTGTPDEAEVAAIKALLARR